MEFHIVRKEKVKRRFRQPIFLMIEAGSNNPIHKSSLTEGHSGLKS